MATCSGAVLVGALTSPPGNTLASFTGGSGNIGLDDRGFGTHSLRRTKVAQLYRKTGNLRAVQLLLGHAKIETTVRYLGVEVDDALRLAEQIEL
jgi:integrase